MSEKYATPQIKTFTNTTPALLETDFATFITTIRTQTTFMVIGTPQLVYNATVPNWTLMLCYSTNA